MVTFFLAKFSLYFAQTCTIAAKPFFFLPPWYEYLGTSHDPLGQCVPDFNFPNGILPVGLAILDMLLRIAGFVAVLSIILAGIQHLFTGGKPENAASARQRILNSLIGLAIVLGATAAVTFIGKQLK